MTVHQSVAERGLRQAPQGLVVRATIFVWLVLFALTALTGAASAAVTPSASTATLAPGSVPLTLQTATGVGNGFIQTQWTGPNGMSDTLTAAPGATIDVQYDGGAAVATVTPPASSGGTRPSPAGADSLATTSTSSCGGATGLSIPDGCDYNQLANTFCAGTSCTHFGFDQIMLNNVKGNVLTGQSINATVTNNGSQHAQYGAVYDEWPNSTGDVVYQFSPSSIVNESAGQISVSLNIPPFFSVSETEDVNYAQTGYYWPHGSNQPAFGAFWHAWSGHFGTPGTGIDSANEVHIGTGQSDFAVVVQVDY